jgi:hypothetical protein
MGGIARRGKCLLGGDGMGAGMARVRLIDYKPPLREIQNYTNGGKTRENIPFEIKKIIDSREWIPKEWKENPRKYSVIKCKFKSFKSKGSTLYVRNRFRRKIFG